MSVLFLGPLPEPVTGHSLACKVFFDELVKHRRVEVVNLNKSGFKQGVSSVARIVEVLRIVWRVWRKRNLAKVIYFTISESYAGNLKDLLIYLACFARLPRMVIHLHGGAGMRKIMLGENRFLRRMNDFFLRRLGAIIVLGERHVDIYAGSVPREKIHIVPNFAEDCMFSSVETISRKFERVKPLRILFLSNLLPGKGHIELVQACRTLDRSTGASVEIDFAGAFESELQRLAFLEMIEGFPQLRYHGTVRGEKKRQLFSKAHVFCLPTYYPYEGQPISILEAYASGCAVITTDHSGIYDVFADGVNGYGVEKGSFLALRSAIEKAVADPQLLHAMALANFNAALQQYRTEHYNSNLIRIIDALGVD